MDRSTNLDIEEHKVRDAPGRVSFLPCGRSHAPLLSCLSFLLPLPWAARIVGGPSGRRVGIWGEAYPAQQGPLLGLRTWMEGGFLELGVHSSAGVPSLPAPPEDSHPVLPLVGYSSTLGTRLGAH